jgi:hypothetical protein
MALCTPVIENLETNFYRVRARLNAHSLGRGEMIKVIIRNPFFNADGTANNLDILVGDGSGQLFEVLPGSSTPEIYAEDLKDLYLRVRATIAGISETDVAVLCYRERRPRTKRKG